MENSRRSFFKWVLGAGSVLLVTKVGQQAWGQEKRRSKKDTASGAASGDLAKPIVNPKDPMPSSLNYVHEKKNLTNAAVKTERQGVPWDKQYCNNCMFYKQAGKKEGMLVGPCTIFQGNLVHDTGWCSSWSKQA